MEKSRPDDNFSLGSLFYKDFVMRVLAGRMYYVDPNNKAFKLGLGEDKATSNLCFMDDDGELHRLIIYATSNERREGTPTPVNPDVISLGS